MPCFRMLFLIPSRIKDFSQKNVIQSSGSQVFLYIGITWLFSPNSSVPTYKAPALRSSFSPVKLDLGSRCPKETPWKVKLWASGVVQLLRNIMNIRVIGGRWGLSEMQCLCRSSGVGPNLCTSPLTRSPVMQGPPGHRPHLEYQESNELLISARVSKEWLILLWVHPLVLSYTSRLH